MLEKRRHPRISEENGIAVKVMSPGAETRGKKSGTFLRLTKDISKSGLRFINNDPLDVDSPVKIHLSLDMPRKIITHVGKIRWVKKAGPNEAYDVGVEFTDTPKIDMQVWSTYIDGRLHKTD